MRWPCSCFEMTSLRFPSRWKYLLLWCLVLDVITCMHSLYRIWVDCTTNGRFSRCELAGRLHCVGAHHSGLLELHLSLFPALLGCDRFCFHIMCIVGQARWCFIRSHLAWVIYTIFLLMINNLWRWDPKNYFKKISSIASYLWAYTTFLTQTLYLCMFLDVLFYFDRRHMEEVEMSYLNLLCLGILTLLWMLSWACEISFWIFLFLFLYVLMWCIFVSC